MYTKNNIAGEWNFLGRTETIDNNLNPKWVKHFHIDYQFEIPIYLKFEVFHEENVNKIILIGELETSMAEILTTPLWLYTKALVNHGKFTGSLIISADVVNSSDDSIAF